MHFTHSHVATVITAGILLWTAPIQAQSNESGVRNLAKFARASTSFVSGHETTAALNDGFEPADSNDKRRGAYGNWPEQGTQWVQYEWLQPVSTAKIAVYWFDDGRGVRLPKACRLKYWDGEQFVAVREARGLGLTANAFNVTTFAEARTTKLRLEIDSNGASTGILDWRVFDSGKSPDFPPIVKAGVDRVVVATGKTFLNGAVTGNDTAQTVMTVNWSQESGPGEAAFENVRAAATTARFSAEGEYVLKLTAGDGKLQGSDVVRVTVVPPPPAIHLTPLLMRPFKISSPLWSSRTKKLITHWIPHCYEKLSDVKLPEGGIENFIQTGNKLAGRASARNVGAPWSNAYVHNTVESMCWALMVDPQGDREMIAAQDSMRAKLDAWIPMILAAQEPEGYLHTFYTLDGHKPWTSKPDHEGYTAGYFIESAIAHYLMTNKSDDRMYRAARKLADCWNDHIGPAPKQAWYDGHEELEQALVRLAWLVDDAEGPGKGRKYIELAKFLLDCRQHGEEYDQSHLPVVQQYEAVGHAVRAVYCYSAMAAVAMETGDLDYHSAALSLWDNIVNKKYYVTGGVGSGETSEGFGPNYSLPNSAYCESCSGCGELFFQHHLNLAHGDAKYADLCEETLYNAVLGDIDLKGENFTYTNALDSTGSRYPWHACPCCVGNIPRTLLMLPTWIYAKGHDELYVNLFIGSTVDVGKVAGTRVEMVLATDYPRGGKVSIAVSPAEKRRFSVKIRIPNRCVSKLHAAAPECRGLNWLAVNGTRIAPAIEKGYATIDREWQTGDKIELELPMLVQRIEADAKVTANRDRVALRCGPLIYCIESVDQDVEAVLGDNAALSTEWKPDLLDGVSIIKGRYTDGRGLTAIPYYARNNRGGRSVVWIKSR